MYIETRGESVYACRIVAGQELLEGLIGAFDSTDAFSLLDIDAFKDAELKAEWEKIAEQTARDWEYRVTVVGYKTDKTGSISADEKPKTIYTAYLGEKDMYIAFGNGKRIGTVGRYIPTVAALLENMKSLTTTRFEEYIDGKMDFEP